jgi:phage-related protein
MVVTETASAQKKTKSDFGIISQIFGIISQYFGIIYHIFGIIYHIFGIIYQCFGIIVEFITEIWDNTMSQEQSM